MTAKTMKAAVVHEFGQPLAIEDVSVPTPGAGQILVKSRRAACATPTSTRPKATGRSSRRFPSSRVTKGSVMSSPWVPVSRT